MVAKLLLLALATTPAGVVALTPGDDLQQAVERLEVVHLGPGDYRIVPAAFVDESCGNCQDPTEPVPATRGLRIRDRKVRIIGAGRDRTVLHTGAGYGILAIDAELELSDLTVTGGVRDADPRATDAAIVVRRSRVKIERCRLADNLGDPAVVATTVVGIAGIAGREGADIIVRDTAIVHNSWDGVALYRGATATIVDTVIDGIDSCRGGHLCGGRGVGIGATWDARATVRGTLVTRYWKGIGAFVDAAVTVEESIVEDVLTWGIAVWDAGADNRPRAVVRSSAVHQTGACGIVVSRRAPAAPGEVVLIGNAVARSGQNGAYDPGEPYCPQRAIALAPAPAGAAIADNARLANREPGDCPGELDVEAPPSAALCDALARWRWPRSSRFHVTFCATQTPGADSP